ncbi:cobalamin biosynthesis protein CobG [Streptomyces sp. ID05-26A]|nr:cobalamin biosynthesis protein CobG [Streptomyces sp. ID05-26A]
MPNGIHRGHPDACPGAVELHQAADGGLARIRVPGGTLSAVQWDVVRTSAAELGNGSVELTSRANLQIRGLADGVELGARLAAAGLLPSASHERIRNIIAAPLEDEQGLVDEIDAALCADPALAALPGRFLLTVGHAVSGLGGDFGLVRDGAATWALLLAGTDTGVRVTDPADTVVTAARLFQRLRGPAWRLSEVDDGVRKITAHFGTSDAPRITPAVTPVAPSPLTPGVPLGRLDAGQLPGVALRLTPWRSLVVPAGTDTSGLITDPDSPWHGVSACTGRPGCAKSLSDVRADARAWLGTPHRRPVHWSGCARRCGRPAGEVIEFVATGDGYEEIR